MANKYLLKWALVLGIVIVLNLFFHFSSKLVYDEPKYDDFCQPKQVNIQPEGEEACLKVGGAWNANPNDKIAMTVTPSQIRESKPVSLNGYCDIYFTCQKQFEEARNLYNRNIFLILIGLGLLSLIAGILLAANEAVSLGLSYGGVLSFVIGATRYWSAMDDYLRVIILGITLIVLFILSYKKFKN